MQVKKEGKYRPPSNVEEESQEDEEEEYVQQVEKKKKKKPKKKKEVEVEEEDEDDDEEEQQQTSKKKKNKNHDIDPNDNYNMSNALHPTAVLFTFLFKGAAAAIYLFGSIIITQQQIIFISVVLLMSFDFWTVKNITGRLLVGLRWWSDYDEEGNEVWQFESPAKKFEANIVDKSFFWTSQFSITVFWMVFLALNVISFTIYWGILDAIGLTLSAINLWGFYKCSKEHQDKMKNMRNDFIKEGLVQMIRRK